MITENLSTLKIHKLTQEQYERELKEGRIDPNAIYLTPDDRAEVNIQSDWAQTDETKADYIKNKPDLEGLVTEDYVNELINQNLTTVNDKANEAIKHAADFVADDDGVHGIKFTPDHKVQIKDEHEVWTTVINPYKTYTAVIDEEESDPDLAVSYADDAKDMEAKSEKWLETDIFKDIRPCVFRDGEVQCYLDPNDYTQQIKNTDPMFYSENEIKLDGKCAYTEIIQAEEAALYDKDGNSLPIGIENSNWGIGYGVQGGGSSADKDRNENITVCYRGTGHMEYKFNVPFTGEYYWIIKFNSQVSNAVRQQEFHINEHELESMITVKNTEARFALTTTDVTLGQLVKERDTSALYRVIDINKLNSEVGYEEYEGAIQTITFPQKGKQWLNENTYWEQEDSKYVFQFMRQRIYCTAGENSIKVYTPADYWSETSVVPTIEIDYMALTSIDTPDITSGIDKEVLSPYFLKENKLPIISDGITTGTLENDSDCAAQVLSFKVTEKGTSDQEARHAIDLGNRDGSNILMNKPINDYPYLRVYYNCFKAGTSNGDICAYVYLKNGTITRIWGKNPAINNSGQFSYFDIDLLSGWTGGEMSGQGYTLNDIDFTKPLVGLQIKPWYNQVRNVGEYFNIIGLAFYKEEYYDDYVPSYFSGDVMIEIPKMGYRFNRVGNNVHVSVTRDPEAVGFSYDAFLRGNRLNDYIYIGAYPGSTYKGTIELAQDNNAKLRSLSQAKVNENPFFYWSVDNYTSAKRLAENNNTSVVKGYSLLTYFPYTLLCCLNLLYNKSIRCSYTETEEAPTRSLLTGDFDKNGMYYMDKDKKCNFKFLGLEDLSGKTYRTSIDGIKYAKKGPLLISMDNLTNENNWFSLENIIPKHGGCKKGIQATNTLGFLTNFEGGGTSSTYYCSSESHQNNLEDLLGLITKTNTGIMSFSIRYDDYDIRGSFSNSRLMYSAE